jgi:hypothetical protein
MGRGTEICGAVNYEKALIKDNFQHIDIEDPSVREELRLLRKDCKNAPSLFE